MRVLLHYDTPRTTVTHRYRYRRSAPTAKISGSFAGLGCNNTPEPAAGLRLQRAVNVLCFEGWFSSQRLWARHLATTRRAIRPVPSSHDPRPQSASHGGINGGIACSGGRPQSAALRGAPRVQYTCPAVGRPLDTALVVSCLAATTAQCPLGAHLGPDRTERVGRAVSAADCCGQPPRRSTRPLGPELHACADAPFPTPSGLRYRAHKAPSCVHNI